MNRSRRDTDAAPSIIVERPLKIGEGRTLVVTQRTGGGGLIMLTRQDEAGRPQINASKVFQFPRHRPPKWEDPAAVQLILDALGVTG